MAVSANYEQDGDYRSTWNSTGLGQVTDENGDFTLRVFPPLDPGVESGREFISVRLEHPDYADRNVTKATIGIYALNPVITLQVGSTIEGRIEGWIDTSDLFVKATRELDPPGDPEAWSESRRIGKDNTFRFGNVPAGVIHVILYRRFSDSTPFSCSRTLSRNQSVAIEPGDLKTMAFQREDVGEISGVLRCAGLDEDVFLWVNLCSGTPELKIETLAGWHGYNGHTFRLLNLTEPGKPYFLRVGLGSTSFDYPLADSIKRDLHVGELNFKKPFPGSPKRDWDVREFVIE